ncbi:MAG: type II secretion system protein GspD [Gemmataceae bacterium]
MSKRLSVAAVALVAAGSFFLVAADKPTGTCGIACTAAKAKTVQKVYEVADLVVSIPGTPAAQCEDEGCCMESVAHGAACTHCTEHEKLIQLVTSTVAPKCWSNAGGSCTIDYFPIGMGLVVNAPADVQEQVADLLAALRRAQDVQVSVELRFITVAEAFFERIGVDFNVKAPACCEQAQACDACRSFRPVALEKTAATNSVILTEKQVFQMMEAAQGDSRTNVMQAPKLTMFSGQKSCVSVVDSQTFVTGVKVNTVNGQAVMVPENKRYELGVKATVQATVSADHKFVQMDFAAEHSQLANSNVQLMPVTTFIAPAFEGGAKGKPVPFTQFIQQPKIKTLSVNSKMCIPDGGTILLNAGTILTEGRAESGPPVLSKIPYVNRLFKNTGYGREAQTMMIMVTPRIIVAQEAFAAKCPGCEHAKCCDSCPKCCDACPKCCEQGCAGCPKCKPVAEEEASAPAKTTAKVTKSPVELRAEKKAAKLVEKYHEACDKGETEKARKIAREALDLDPACFTKPVTAAAPGALIGHAAAALTGSAVGQPMPAPAPMPPAGCMPAGYAVMPPPFPMQPPMMPLPPAVDPFAPTKAPGLFRRIFFRQSAEYSVPLPDGVYLQHPPQYMPVDAGLPFPQGLPTQQAIFPPAQMSYSPYNVNPASPPEHIVAPRPIR